MNTEMTNFKVYNFVIVLLFFILCTCCFICDAAPDKSENGTNKSQNRTNKSENKTKKSENGAEALPAIQSPIFTSPPKNATKTSRSDVVDILPAGYYRDVAPMVDGKPVKVTVSVVILNFKLSQGSSQTFDADIFFHNYWTDHRLQKPTNEASIAQRINLSEKESLSMYKLSDSWKRRLWVPDTYFRNAIAGGVSNILTPTHYYTITNYTEVFMSVRLSLKLSCEMDFSKFPFDSQKCFFNLSMTSEDIHTVELDWYSFRVGSHVDKTEFQITNTSASTCTKNLDIGVFSCLYGEIHFRRNIGNYMIKKFIPSFIIVVITFMGFWIPTTVAPARTSLPITALLALITQQIQSDLTVSYVYALQVWNIVCIIFVFANLFEFSIALFAMHMRQKLKERAEKEKKSEDKKDLIINMEMSERNGGCKKGGDEEDDKKNMSLRARQWRHFKTEWAKVFAGTTRHSSVDIVSRYVFPTAYFLFCVFFFVWVLA